MTRTATGVLGVALVAALLTGCSAQPRAAAVVDGTVISQAEVEQTFDELGPILADAKPSAVVQALILAPSVIGAAADNGVGVSDQDGAELLDAVMTNAGLDPAGSWSHGSLQIARSELSAQALANLPDGAALLEQARASATAQEVEVNPQYGQLVAETGVIDPIARPWIAQE